MGMTMVNPGLKGLNVCVSLKFISVDHDYKGLVVIEYVLGANYLLRLLRTMFIIYIQGVIISEWNLVDLLNKSRVLGLALYAV